MKTRLLGVILIVCVILLNVDGYRTSDTQGVEALDKISNLVYLLWGIGGISGIMGLMRLNALGSNAIARASSFLPMIGFAAFILGAGLQLVDFIAADSQLYSILASIAWLGMLAGMLIVGILTIAAKTWQGWRRFVPLSTVVLIPIGFGIGGLIGSNDLGGTIGYIGWLLLGYVIATAEPSLSLSPTAVA